MSEQKLNSLVGNVNQMVQEHLDQKGCLELVIQRDGKVVLDMLPINVASYTNPSN